MFAPTALSLLMLAAGAGPVKISPAGELSFEAGTGMGRWYAGDRYVHLDKQWLNGPDGRRLAGATFVFGDVLKQKTLRYTFSSEALLRAHPDVFKEPPRVRALYFDGTRALLEFNKGDVKHGGGTQFCWWDLKSTDCALTEIVRDTALPAQTYFLAHKEDPQGRHFYLSVASYTGESPRNGLVSYRLMRVPLHGSDSLVAETVVDLELPKRDHPLRLNNMIFSADGTKLALIEYAELSYLRDFKPDPQAYVIDLVEKVQLGRYPIPVTAYGVAFSGNGRYLAIASNELGEVVRVDLQAKKIDKRVKGMTKVQEIFAPPGSKHFLVYAGFASGPRPLEVRRWSDLELVQKVDYADLFPGFRGADAPPLRLSADGRSLISPAKAADNSDIVGKYLLFSLQAP